MWGRFHEQNFTFGGVGKARTVRVTEGKQDSPLSVRSRPREGGYRNGRRGRSSRTRTESESRSPWLSWRVRRVSLRLGDNPGSKGKGGFNETTSSTGRCPESGPRWRRSWSFERDGMETGWERE